MANLTPDPERERRAASRSCGECSLCCTILRVEELAKPAGVDCLHQRSVGPDGRHPAGGTRATGAASPVGGCGIYATRPPICRGYRCLWLQGGLKDDERPDRLGGVVDLETTGIGLRLAIREARRGAFDASPALQAIAERYREQMPVRISDAEDVMNPDRPFRVLLADGIEQRIQGESMEIHRRGLPVETRRLPWAERLGRRLSIAWRSRRLGRTGAGRR